MHSDGVMSGDGENSDYYIAFWHFYLLFELQMMAFEASFAYHGICKSLSTSVYQHNMIKASSI